ncbi:hypothetical protein DFAR_2180020 [Desulfarculales bacterium]
MVQPGSLALRPGRTPPNILNVPHKPHTRQLVTNSPYALTRNRMVFRMICFYLALSVIQDKFLKIG